MTMPAAGHVMPGAAFRLQRKHVQITSTQLLALNATPQTLVAAPGVGFALIFQGLFIQKPAGTAYGGIALGEDLSVKYTGAAGAEQGQCETTGFLDSAANQIRYVNPYHAASLISSITPVEDAPLVLQLLLGEIITGDSPLNCVVLYQVVDVTPQAG